MTTHINVVPQTYHFYARGTTFMKSLLIDLSIAFDCILHGLLIAKMKAYGLSDEACTFMSSNICDRYQRVKVSNTKSSWTKLTKGIPQGSGLHPFY